jgi:tight adherence protein B
MSLLTTFFLLAFGLCLIILIFGGLPSPQERTIEARITDIRNPRRILRHEGGEADLAEGESGTLSERLGHYLMDYSFSPRIEILLLEADSKSTVGSLVLKSIRFLVAGGVIGFALLQSMVGALTGAAIAGVLPFAKLKWKRSRRLIAVTAALPDAADLMARALRAGHSVTQAIEAMAEQAPKPLSIEFAKVFQQQKLGIPLRKVLIDLGLRVPSRDLHFLITAILVQRETGGDLAEILDRTTETLRERIRVEGEVRVHTAQGRLTGWILSILPLTILGLISLFCPSYTHVLFTDPLGQKLLYAAGACMIAGALVIRRIVKVTF